MPSSSTRVHDELFTAIKGKGAQLNGTPIRASTCVRIEDALVGTVIPGARQRAAGRVPSRARTRWSRNAPAFAAPAPARSTSLTSRRDGSTATG